MAVRMRHRWAWPRTPLVLELLLLFCLPLTLSMRQAFPPQFLFRLQVRECQRFPVALRMPFSEGSCAARGPGEW